MASNKISEARCISSRFSYCKFECKTIIDNLENEQLGQKTIGLYLGSLTPCTVIL